MMARAGKKIVDPAVAAKQKVKRWITALRRLEDLSQALKLNDSAYELEDLSEAHVSSNVEMSALGSGNTGILAIDGLRIQVHLRHNGQRIFFGGFYREDYADFARDFSEFLTRYCQDKTLTGGYHHCCSPEIFLEFELPPHKPLAPICKQLPNYNKEDPDVVNAYTTFALDARNHINKMLLHLTTKPVESRLNSGKECGVTWSSSFTPISKAKKFVNDHYNDWAMLAELVDILGTEGIMTCFLTRFSEGSSLKDFPGDQTSELQGGNLNDPSLCHSEHNTAVGDHSAQSQINQSAANVFDISFANLEACQINPVDFLPPISSEAMPDMMSLSEAKRYLDEHFLDNHWLILAEIVKSFGIDTVALLFEDSSF